MTRRSIPARSKTNSALSRPISPRSPRPGTGGAGRHGKVVPAGGPAGGVGGDPDRLRSEIDDMHPSAAPKGRHIWAHLVDLRPNPGSPPPTTSSGNRVYRPGRSRQPRRRRRGRVNRDEDMHGDMPAFATIHPPSRCDGAETSRQWGGPNQECASECGGPGNPRALPEGSLAPLRGWRLSVSENRNVGRSFRACHH